MVRMSSNMVAIKIAKAAGTLGVQACYNDRLGITYWAIMDDKGVIEICLTHTEATDIITAATQTNN